MTIDQYFKMCSKCRKWIGDNVIHKCCDPEELINQASDKNNILAAIDKAEIVYVLVLVSSIQSDPVHFKISKKEARTVVSKYYSSNKKYYWSYFKDLKILFIG